MKIIITGALGHIGSHFIRRLPDFFDHLHIVMIDNLSTQRYASLFNLPNTASYQFIEADITHKDTQLSEIFKDADVVIHLAAITDAAASFNHADEVRRVNLTGTTHVANACIQAKVPLMMASSTSVYGTQANQVDENCSVDELKPQSPYAETKLQEEALIQKYCAEKNLNAVIFRFGTLFGASIGMRFHTAVNKFCWQAVMNQPLTVWKTAYHQKRPYLSLDDALQAIVLILKNNVFDGRVYNVISMNASVSQVIETIKTKIPDLKINFVENQIMNQLSYEVLNTRMNALGFKSTENFDQEISNTLSLLKPSNTFLNIGCECV